MATSTSSTKMHKKEVSTARFYLNWSGHPVEDLTVFRDITLAKRPDKPIVYLAGDSSLDNKYWVHKSIRELSIDAPEIYQHTLTDPCPKPDVAFWLNHGLGARATCINTAIEETMLRSRDDALLPQDEFIRDNIRANDFLIVSVGANDIALRPTSTTIRHMLQLAWLTRRSSIENQSASSLQYFKNLFGTKTQSYIAHLTSKTRPRAVLICMIYFPLEAGFGQTSWADMQLKALGYNSNPAQLQAAIRAMYEMATKCIEIEGTETVPCPLFEVLDGKTAGEYTARVEPNEEGGRKMAEKFRELIDEVLKADDA